MRFSSIPGYEVIKERLTRAADAGQVAHAQLFACSEGGFGLMMALAFAQYLNCEKPENSDSCGTCFSCIKSSRFVHPDFHYLFPLAKSKKFDTDELAALTPSFRNFLGEIPFGTVNDWAELAGFENRSPLINIRSVRETIQGLQLKAFEAKYKIQIIWQPESMRSEGANAFLKILEEPPERSIFLVISHQPDLLLPTLISRMQRVTIPVPSEEQMGNFLKQRFDEEGSRLNTAISLSEGSLSEAIRLLEEKEDDYHQRFMDWQRACFKQDTSRILQLSEEFQEMGKELQKTFLKYATGKTRKAFVFSAQASEILQIPESEKTDLQNLGKIMHEEMTALILSELDKAWFNIERNSSARMVFFDCSIQLAIAYKIPRTIPA